MCGHEKIFFSGMEKINDKRFSLLLLFIYFFFVALNGFAKNIGVAFLRRECHHGHNILKKSEINENVCQELN